MAVAMLVLSPAATAADERANVFNDPFSQVTSAIKDCPPQAGPLLTKAEMQAQAHARTERGTRCYESGRCRLPSSYLYDQEIIPRVRKAILADGRFADTSLWIEGQRRWVWLKGCVRTRAQADALGRLARQIDDVEQVFNELVVRR
jgi:osmotically-inducible protein OsmY